MWLVGPSICWRVGGTRDIPVEALFPKRRERFESGASGWSRVLGIDAVGGPPHCDFADEGGAEVAFWYCPGWRVGTLAGVVLNLVGEVGEQLRSPCQVGPQAGWSCSVDGMPGSQRSGPGSIGVSAVRRQYMTAAISPALLRSRPKAAVSRWRSGCSPVSAARLRRCARRVGQAGSLVSAGRYWSAWSSSATASGPTSCSAATWRLFGVALDRVEEPARWVVELAQHGVGGDRRVVAGEDLLQRLARRAR
jgi:hypothetical protein